MKNIRITNNNGKFVEFSGSEIGTLEGWEYPSVINVLQDIAGDRSPTYISSKRGRRRFSLTALKVPFTFEDRAYMLGVLGQDGNMKLLEFTTLNDLTLRCYVEILDVKIPYHGTSKPVMVEMVAPDSRFYTQSLYNVYTGVTLPGGGASIPATIPMSFNYASGNTRPVIIPTGNTSVPPTFIIQGPGTTFVVQNISTGKKFNLNTTLTSVEHITVDTVNKTVIKGTNTNVFGVFDGDFFDLVIGNNEIHFNAISGSSATTKLSIQYRGTYEGL